MNRKRVNLVDIAQVCGVSVGTVSRALAGDDLININTRERIIKVSKDLGYVPNEMARSLLKRFNKIIGLLIPDIMNPFFSQVAKATEEYARQHDFSVFLCNTNLDSKTEKHYIRQLYSYKVAGIIILPISEDFADFAKQYFSPENIVYLSYRPATKDANFVITDDRKIIVTAVDYLASMGHTRMSYVSGGENLSISNRRYKSFCSYMKKQGLQRVELGGKLKYYFVDPVEELAHDLSRAKELPTAFICYNDKLAIELLDALGRVGLKVPKDVSVLGIDDTFVSGLSHIKLTTVGQHMREMGKLAAKVVIDNAMAKKARFYNEVLIPELVIRASVRDISRRVSTNH